MRQGIATSPDKRKCPESERWYYWTDKLGLLVWQDFPSISNMAKIEKEDKENFEREYTQ